MDANNLQETKLQYEVAKLKREVEENYEKRRLDADMTKHSKDHKRSTLALYFGVLSPLVALSSLFVTYYSVSLNKEVSESNLKISNESLRQSKIERIDKLKSEFDNNGTIRERRSSIAYELITLSDSTVISPYDRKRYEQYYNEFANTISEKEDATGNLSGQIAQNATDVPKEDLGKLNEAEQTQIILENQLASAKTPSEEKAIQTQLKSITQDLSQNTQVIKLLDSLSKTQKDLTRYEKESSVSTPLVTWLKEGYYRPYESLTISLTELSPTRGSGVIRIREKANDQDEAQEIARIPFTVPSKKTFTYSGRTYEIEFVKIGLAGKNPFTKAVYFSVVQIGGTGKFDGSFDRTFQ